MNSPLKNALLVIIMSPLITFAIYQLYRAAIFQVIHVRQDISLGEAPGAFTIVVLLYVAALGALIYALHGALTGWKNLQPK